MRVLFYGDSNTYGYDPRDPFEDRYPASVRWTDRLASALAGRWEVAADGMNGRCVPAMPSLEGYLRSLMTANRPVDRFAVMLGTNDLLGTHRPDAALPAARMEALLGFLQREYPHMERMLIAPPILFDGLEGAWFRRCQEESRRLTELYRALARQSGTLYADAGAWSIDMSTDFVHFSERGHMQFAEHIRKFFK